MLAKVAGRGGKALRAGDFVGHPGAMGQAGVALCFLAVAKLDPAPMLVANVHGLAVPIIGNPDPASVGTAARDSALSTHNAVPPYDCKRYR